MRPNRFVVAFLASAALALLPAPGAEARSFRIGLIPNGTALDGIGCANCHISPFGGGPRNAFGQAVEELVTPGGAEFFWSAALAGEDSDGDGFTNGLELQDPSGGWTVGQPNPGDGSKVANPGLASSVPPDDPTPTPTTTPSPTDTPEPSPTATPTPTGTPGPTPTPTATPAPSARLTNISTRGFVGSGSEVMIAGLIVDGTGPAEVLISGIGPDLAQFGITNYLEDPALVLFDENQQPILESLDWMSGDPAQVERIMASGFAPNVSSEAAIAVTLPPGQYTAQLRGQDGGTGIGLAQIFDLGGEGRLINISTRLAVGTGDRVMIAGVTVSGSGSRAVIFRGLGPTLGNFGVPNHLADPELALVSGSEVIAANANWADTQELEITLSGFAPFFDEESAIIDPTLPPGVYTAILSGANGTSGTGLIEVYELNE